MNITVKNIKGYLSKKSALFKEKVFALPSIFNRTTQKCALSIFSPVVSFVGASVAGASLIEHHGMYVQAPSGKLYGALIDPTTAQVGIVLILIGFMMQMYEKTLEAFPDKGIITVLSYALLLFLAGFVLSKIIIHFLMAR